MLHKKIKIAMTGASGGLGKPLVKALKASGAEVLSIDRQIHGELVQNLHSITKIIMDFEPEVFIHMAGHNQFDACEQQDYQSLLEVNLMVPMMITQAVLPQMKQRRAGHIITIGSMMGLIPLPYFSGYVAAKAGLKGFSDSLRREVHADHISVTHIVPRAVKTDMNKGKSEIFNARTHATLDTPDYVVARIMKAIEKKESEVRFGCQERVIAMLQSLFPKMLDRALIKQATIAKEILTDKLELTS